MQAGTSAFVAFHAAARSQAVALIQNGAAVTYAQFDADLNRATRLLDRFGLTNGAIVAIECTDTYLHWLVLLACERLGLVSGSYDARETPPPAGMLAHAALVLHGEPLPTPVTCPARQFDAALLQDLRAQPEGPLPPRPAQGPDQLQRLRRSSGTTGTPKSMVTNAGAQDWGVLSNAYTAEMTAGSRALVFNNFWVGGLYQWATAVLRMGATLIVDRRDPPEVVLRRYRPTHLRIMIGELVSLLNRLPADFERLDELVVDSGGSILTPFLRAGVLERLAGRVFHNYGTNEALRLAASGQAEISTVLPGVRVELMDDFGRPAPLGAGGLVRATSPARASNYLGDPESTAALLGEDWFQTSDRAEWVGPRTLRLVGRSDDLLTLAAGKLQPEWIEALVRDAAPGAEVAVIGLRNETGMDDVCIALALAPGQDRKTVTEAVAARLPRYLGPVRLRVVPSLPRGPGGKVPREALLTLFHAS